MAGVVLEIKSQGLDDIRKNLKALIDEYSAKNIILKIDIPSIEAIKKEISALAGQVSELEKAFKGIGPDTKIPAAPDIVSPIKAQAEEVKNSINDMVQAIDNGIKEAESDFDLIWEHFGNEAEDTIVRTGEKIKLSYQEIKKIVRETLEDMLPGERFDKAMVQISKYINSIQESLQQESTQELIFERIQREANKTDIALKNTIEMYRDFLSWVKHKTIYIPEDRLKDAESEFGYSHFQLKQMGFNISKDNRYLGMDGFFNEITGSMRGEGTPRLWYSLLPSEIFDSINAEDMFATLVKLMKTARQVVKDGYAEVVDEIRQGGEKLINALLDAQYGISEAKIEFPKFDIADLTDIDTAKLESIKNSLKEFGKVITDYKEMSEGKISLNVTDAEGNIHKLTFAADSMLEKFTLLSQETEIPVDESKLEKAKDNLDELKIKQEDIESDKEVIPSLIDTSKSLADIEAIDTAIKNLISKYESQKIPLAIMLGTEQLEEFDKEMQKQLGVLTEYNKAQARIIEAENKKLEIAQQQARDEAKALENAVKAENERLEIAQQQACNEVEALKAIARLEEAENKRLMIIQQQVRDETEAVEAARKLEDSRRRLLEIEGKLAESRKEQANLPEPTIITPDVSAIVKGIIVPSIAIDTGEMRVSADLVKSFLKELEAHYNNIGLAMKDIMDAKAIEKMVKAFEDWGIAVKNADLAIKHANERIAEAQATDKGPTIAMWQALEKAQEKRNDLDVAYQQILRNTVIEQEKIALANKKITDSITEDSDEAQKFLADMKALHDEAMRERQIRIDTSEAIDNVNNLKDEIKDIQPEPIEVKVETETASNNIKEIKSELEALLETFKSPEQIKAMSEQELIAGIVLLNSQITETRKNLNAMRPELERVIGIQQERDPNSAITAKYKKDLDDLVNKTAALVRQQDTYKESLKALRDAEKEQAENAEKAAEAADKKVKATAAAADANDKLHNSNARLAEITVKTNLVTDEIISTTTKFNTGLTETVTIVETATSAIEKITDKMGKFSKAEIKEVDLGLAFKSTKEEVLNAIQSIEGFENAEVRMTKAVREGNDILQQANVSVKLSDNTFANFTLSTAMLAEKSFLAYQGISDINSAAARLGQQQSAIEKFGSALEDITITSGVGTKVFTELITSALGIEGAWVRMTPAVKFGNDLMQQAWVTSEAAGGGFKTLQVSVNQTTGALHVADKGIQQTNKGLSLGKQIAEETGEEFERFGKKGTDAIDALATALAAAGVAKTLSEIKKLLWDSMEAAIAFEKAMAGARRTLGGSENEIRALGNSFKELSLSIPISAVEMGKLAEQAGQLGIERENAEEFVRIMSMLGTATDMTAESASTMLAQFVAVTGMGVENYERLGSTVAGLGDATAATSEKITRMSLRMAAAASIAGISEKDILSLAATLGGLGVEAEAGGSAMGRLIQRLQLAVETGKNLDDYARAAKMSAREFKHAWGVDAAGALQAFIVGLADMDAQGQSAIALLDEIGITDIRLSRSILALAHANDKMTETFALGNKLWAENTALTEKAAIMYETTAAKQQLLENATTNLSREIGDQLLPAFNKLLDTGISITQWATELVETMDWLAPALTGLAAGLTVLVVVPATLALIAKAIAAIGAALGVAAGPVGWVALGLGAITAALVGLAVAEANSTPEIEKHSKAMFDASETYKDAEKNIKSLGEAIEATQAKIEALKDAEAPPLVDQTEINNLKITKEVLESNLKIEQERARIAKERKQDEAMAVLYAPVYAEETDREKMLRAHGAPIPRKETTAAGALLESLEAYIQIRKETDALIKANEELAESTDDVSDSISNNKKEIESNIDAMAGLSIKIGELSPPIEEALASLEDTKDVKYLIELLNIFAMLLGKVAIASDEAAPFVFGVAEVYAELAKARADFAKGDKSEDDYIKALTGLKKELLELRDKSQITAKDFKEMSNVIDYSLSKTQKSQKEMRDTTLDLAGAYDMLQSAVDEYADKGTLSLQTALKWIDEGYAAALVIDEETGLIKLNGEAYLFLAQARHEDLIVKQQAQLIFSIANLRQEEDAVTRLGEAFFMTGAAREYDAWQAAKANLITAQATVDSYEAQIATLIKLQSTFGKGVPAPTPKKKEMDENLEAFNKAYKELQRLRDTVDKQHQISTSEYLERLDVLYKKHFSNLEKYQDEYSKYENEVFKAREDEFARHIDTLQYVFRMDNILDTDEINAFFDNLKRMVTKHIGELELGGFKIDDAELRRMYDLLDTLDKNRVSSIAEINNAFKKHLSDVEFGIEQMARAGGRELDIVAAWEAVGEEIAAALQKAYTEGKNDTDEWVQYLINAAHKASQGIVNAFAGIEKRNKEIYDINVKLIEQELAVRKHFDALTHEQTMQLYDGLEAEAKRHFEMLRDLYKDNAVERARIEEDLTNTIIEINKRRYTELKAQLEKEMQAVMDSFKEQEIEINVQIKVHDDEIKKIDNAIKGIREGLADVVKPLESAVKALDKELRGLDNEIRVINDTLKDSLKPIEANINAIQKEIDALEEARRIEESRNRIEEARLQLIERERALQAALEQRVIKSLVGESWVWQADYRAIRKAEEDLKTARKRLEDEEYRLQVDRLKQQQKELKQQADFLKEQAALQVELLNERKRALEDNKRALQEQIEYHKEVAEEQIQHLEGLKKQHESERQAWQERLNLIKEQADNARKEFEILKKNLETMGADLYDGIASAGNYVTDAIYDIGASLKAAIENAVSLIGEAAANAAASLAARAAAAAGSAGSGAGGPSASEVKDKLLEGVTNVPDPVAGSKPYGTIFEIRGEDFIVVGANTPGAALYQGSWVVPADPIPGKFYPSTYDSGGLAFGRGILPKGTDDPEMVLDPKTTRMLMDNAIEPDRGGKFDTIKKAIINGIGLTNILDRINANPIGGRLSQAIQNYYAGNHSSIVNNYGHTVNGMNIGAQQAAGMTLADLANNFGMYPVANFAR